MAGRRDGSQRTLDVTSRPSSLSHQNATFDLDSNEDTNDDFLSEGDTLNPRLTEERALRQGNFLLDSFLHKRFRQDGVDNEVVQQLGQATATRPLGMNSEFVREFGRAVQTTGDQLDNDREMQKLLDQVPEGAESHIWRRVAEKVFDVGKLTWGKVLGVFYLAYKFCKKAIYRTAEVIAAIMGFIKDRVISWILSLGGWDAYLGATTTWQTVFVLGLGVATAGLAVYRKLYS